MRWFQYSIADFEETLNPENGGFVVMERKEKDDTVRSVFLILCHACRVEHCVQFLPFDVPLWTSVKLFTLSVPCLATASSAVWCGVTVLIWSGVAWCG